MPCLFSLLHATTMSVHSMTQMERTPSMTGRLIKRSEPGTRQTDNTRITSIRVNSVESLVSTVNFILRVICQRSVTHDMTLGLSHKSKDFIMLWLKPMMSKAIFSTRK